MMKITLCDDATYARLREIVNNYPKLMLQYKGYYYLRKSELTPAELEAHNEVADILREHIDGFSEFYNYCLNLRGELQLRFTYAWDTSFLGVGYLFVEELRYGFRDTKECGWEESLSLAAQTA